MNEASAEPIAQATEEVMDVTENVESIDAPPVTGLVEEVQVQDIPTEPIEPVAMIQDELIPFMNEPAPTPIAPGTEEVLVRTENVESIDAPPVTGRVEEVQVQDIPIEPI